MLYDWNNAMDMAVAAASMAAIAGEVPVGALMLLGEEVIATAYNQRESDKDPLAHAEILVIREAARKLGRWRLTGCTLVVTLEPCPMCAGALVNARIDRLVFGAWDKRVGAAGSVFELVQDKRLNHRLEVIAGVQAERCGRLLSNFFAARRKI